MKRLILFSAISAMNILFSALFSTIHAQNQEPNEYYYQGYTFEQTNGAKSASPYLTIVMIGDKNTVPEAVSMSNAIGDVSFKGTPTNIYIQNKLEVYAGNKLIGVYLPKKWTTKPPFPSGNMNTHMEVPFNLDFYKTKELTIPTEQISLRSFLSGISDIEIEEDNFFIKGYDGSLRLFVNNNNLPADKIKSLLDHLTVNYIKSCQLIVFNEPNKYFSGAINITLTVGDPGKFPSDTQYINSLPLCQ